MTTLIRLISKALQTTRMNIRLLSNKIRSVSFQIDNPSLTGQVTVRLNDSQYQHVPNWHDDNSTNYQHELSSPTQTNENDASHAAPPHHYNPRKFTMYDQNVQGRRSKLKDFMLSSTRCIYDVIALTEMSLIPTINDGKLFDTSDYCVYTCDRSDLNSTTKAGF